MRIIVKIVDVILVALIVLITITVALQIISRSIYPITWSEEFAKINLMWIVYLSLVGSFYYEKHVRIDLIDDMKFIPDKVKKGINFVLYPVSGLVLSFFIIKYSVELFRTQYHYGQVTSILQWPFYMIVIPFILGGVLMFLLFLSRIVQTILQYTRRSRNSG